jgi:hypothetical protein
MLVRLFPTSAFGLSNTAVTFRRIGDSTKYFVTILRPLEAGLRETLAHGMRLLGVASGTT